MACQLGAEPEGDTQSGQKRQRRKRGDKPLTLARYKPTLSEAIEWAHAAWENMPRSVIVNSWCKSGVLPASFWEDESLPREQQTVETEQVIAQQYAATDAILEQFREYFPGIMTTAEYTEGLTGEDLAIEQPPTATEFVEQILATNSSSSEEEVEEEDEVVTTEEYKKGFSAVEKYVHQNSQSFGPKIMSCVFLIKQASQRRKIDMDLRKNSEQASIRDYLQ